MGQNSPNQHERSGNVPALDPRSTCLCPAASAGRSAAAPPTPPRPTLLQSSSTPPPILLLLSVYTYNTANPFYFSLPTLFPAFMHFCYYIHKFPIPYTFFSHILDILNKYFVSKYLVNTIPNLTHSYACTLPLLLSMRTIQYTLCPGSSDQFYIVTYYTKLVTTSWTYSN